MPDVEVLKQASWGATRDNLVLGGEGNGIDGAHILTPMPYLISRRQGDAEQRADADVHPGAAQSRQPVHLGRQGIRRPARSALDTKPFKAALDKKKASGKSVKAANTFPGGTHDLWIRYWLAAGGIDPDKDIETITVPPPQMVANMKVGTMDCFCVCEPWNLQLIHQNIGYTAITTGELWNKHPEKSLGMRAAWVDKNPNAAKALLMAVMEAQQWCDKPENHEELARDHAPSASGSTPGRGHHRPHQGQVRLRHPRQGGRELAAHHEVLERPRLLSVPEPRPLVHHRGHPLGQVRGRRSTPRR